MKAKFLLPAAYLLSAHCAFAATVIASDGFESGNFSSGTDQWTTGSWSNSGFAVTTGRSNSGTSAAESRTGSSGGILTDTLERGIDLSTAVDPALTFAIGSRFTEDGDESVVVKFDPGTGTFITLDTINIPANNSSTTFENYAYDATDLGTLTGSTQRIRFEVNFDSSSSDFIFLDDITFTAVPEPSTALLGALGALGLLRRRR